MDICRSITCLVVLLSIYYCREAVTQGNCPSDRPFKCNSTSSKCIPLSWLCDSNTHCNGSEDEINCNNCSGSGFLCKSTKTCLPPYTVCDGKYDCPSGEDEQICGNCTSDRPFKCNSRNSKCIWLSWVCDGYKDCNGGEDEINCAISTPTTTQHTESSNSFMSTSTSKSTKAVGTDVSPTYTQRTTSTTRSTSMSTIIVVSTTPFIPNSTSESTEGDGETEEGNPTNAPILGTGAYVGIILGGIVGVLIIAAIIFLLYRCVKQRKRHNSLEEANRKSVRQLEGIPNSAMNISDDTSNTVASENLQQPYYNSPSTLDRIRPQANLQRTRIDSNSTVGSNYMDLNDNTNVESMTPYDSLKINDISNAVASENLQQPYYNSPYTLNRIIPQENCQRTMLDSNSPVDSNYMALNDKRNVESLQPYDSLKINDISNAVASENLKRPYYNIPSTWDRIRPQANFQSTRIDRNSPEDSNYMALKDKETRKSLHPYDSLKVN